MNDFNRISQHYQRNIAEILGAPAHRWGIDPYAWDHEAGISLTPIEAALWSDIRYLGCVFYPQFPVGRYFVDFGNPVAKVAIECDGAEFHQDKAKDEKRQREIEAAGWTVYRITGRECKTDFQEVEDDNGNVKTEPGYALRFVSDISSKHGLSPGSILGEAYEPQGFLRGLGLRKQRAQGGDAGRRIEREQPALHGRHPAAGRASRADA